MSNSSIGVVHPFNTEAIKWFALVLMVLDHMNKYLWHESNSALFALGRLCMPLFGYVIAFNLARHGQLNLALTGRIATRLLIAGLVATPIFIALGGLVFGWWPLNIMFTLLVAVIVIQLIDLRRHFSALIAFLVLGFFVEFWWFGIGFIIAAWMNIKNPSAMRFAFMAAMCGSLAVVNQNYWALGALFVIVLAQYPLFEIKRLKWAFYVFYPAHLAVLLAVQKLGNV